MSVKAESLACRGGPPVRTAPFPARRQFGEAELAQVRRVFEDAWSRGLDFGYQGPFEREYCEAFCAFQGGGYADAVCTGTAAILVALAALDLKPGSEVMVSPVTDPGGVSPVLILGHVPVVADSRPGSFNLGPEEFEAALTPATRAAIVTHLAGIPVEMEPILEIAADRGVAVLEDCSQAHGAVYRGRRVGTLGDIAAFSTMFSKNHSTGGCGGVVYTRDPALYRRVRALADRGKPFADAGFDPKDPRLHLFPALNLNQDELSCAIGLSTLGRLPATIARRNAIVAQLRAELAEVPGIRVARYPADVTASPFFLTVEVEPGAFSVATRELAEAVAAEGAWVNPEYQFVVAEWPFLQKALGRIPTTLNASAYKRASFNLLFHERFDDGDVSDVARCVAKVAHALAAH